DTQPALGQRAGAMLSGRAGAQHDDVVVVAHGDLRSTQSVTIEAYSPGASSQTECPASTIMSVLWGRRSARNSALTSGPTVTPPPPTTTLEKRSGRDAAAKSAAEVPMSGPTTCGRPRPHVSISRARKSPIASGDRRSSRRSEPPKPGRSTAKSRKRGVSSGQIGANAYTLSGHGLVSRITR